MRSQKSQSSLETIFLAGIIIAALIPLFYYISGQFGYIGESKISESLETAGSSARTILSLGVGSLKTVEIFNPAGIQSYGWENNRKTLKLLYNDQDVTYTFPLEVVAIDPNNPSEPQDAQWPITEGTHRIRLLNYGEYLIFSQCGNNVLEFNEQCDSLQAATCGSAQCNNDCTCYCENQLQCPFGMDCINNHCTEVGYCGDRITQPSLNEQCDDGGLCSGSGAACASPGECDAGETCNPQSGDGCSATCQIEVSVCGNNIVEQGEQCDDGNTVSGDGCSDTCQVEDSCNSVVEYWPVGDGPDTAGGTTTTSVNGAVAEFRMFPPTGGTNQLVWEEGTGTPAFAQQGITFKETDDGFDDYLLFDLDVFPREGTLEMVIDAKGSVLDGNTKQSIFKSCDDVDHGGCLLTRSFLVYLGAVQTGQQKKVHVAFGNPSLYAYDNEACAQSSYKCIIDVTWKAGDTLKLYVNGQLVGQGDRDNNGVPDALTQQDIDAVGGPFAFGIASETAFANQWLGSLYQYIVYKRVLTGEEVQANYDEYINSGLLCGVSGGGICGDGELNLGEECDNGVANSPTGTCNTDCKLTICGDGIMQTTNGQNQQEECDDLDFNGRTCRDYGFSSGFLSCTSTCEVDDSGCRNAQCANTKDDEYIFGFPLDGLIDYGPWIWNDPGCVDSGDEDEREAGSGGSNAYCGDGIKQVLLKEECDPGSYAKGWSGEACQDPDMYCTLTCQCVTPPGGGSGGGGGGGGGSPRCGDGIPGNLPTEECDPPGSVGKIYYIVCPDGSEFSVPEICNLACNWVMDDPCGPPPGLECGNSILNTDEDCDPPGIIGPERVFNCPPNVPVPALCDNTCHWFWPDPCQLGGSCKDQRGADPRCENPGDTCYTMHCPPYSVMTGGNEYSCTSLDDGADILCDAACGCPALTCHYDCQSVRIGV